MSGTLRQAPREREKGGDEGAVSPGAGRTGLYFCRCGPNLGALVRLGELGEPARWPGAADVATHDVLCSGAGRAWLAGRIRAKGLERVVVAACSPREHEQTFRAVLAAEGLSPFHLQMANLREQVEWVGGDAERATERARRLVAAALRRVALHEAIPAADVEVSPDVLVVGAGPAGVAAALALARRGRRVILAERERALGGLAGRLDEIFPDLECASCFMEPALDAVLHSPHVEVVTGAEVARVRGAEGSFEVELAVRGSGVDATACLGCGECARACPVEVSDPFAGGLARRRAIGLAYPGCLPHVSAIDADACLRGRGEPCDACAAACALGAVTLDLAVGRREVTVGAVVVATGLRPGEVDGPDGLVSSYQLERMLHPDGPTRGALRGAGGREPRAVLLATTAAEEDGDLAAEEVLKLAHRVRARLPGASVAVAGDLGALPRLARRAAALANEGVELLRGALAPHRLVAAGDVLAVRLRDPEGDVVRTADLVVVHPPSRPAEGTAALARLLRVAPTERGFLRDRGADPFEPTATRIAGVYVAGAAAGPRTVPQAIRDGTAAAGLVLASLAPGERKALEPLAARVDEARCGGCAICAAACPFRAIVLEPREPAGAASRARVEAVHCRGCGTCAAACPTGAVHAPHFAAAQIAAEISALLADGDALEPPPAPAEPARAPGER